MNKLELLEYVEDMFEILRSQIHLEINTKLDNFEFNMKRTIRRDLEEKEDNKK